MRFLTPVSPSCEASCEQSLHIQQAVLGHQQPGAGAGKASENHNRGKLDALAGNSADMTKISRDREGEQLSVTIAWTERERQAIRHVQGLFQLDAVHSGIRKTALHTKSNSRRSRDEDPARNSTPRRSGGDQYNIRLGQIEHAPPSCVPDVNAQGGRDDQPVNQKVGLPYRMPLMNTRNSRSLALQIEKDSRRQPNRRPPARDQAITGCQSVQFVIRV